VTVVKTFSPFLHKKFTLNMNNILGVNRISRLAVAVSGGGDSIALLHLIAEWSEAKDISITVFTVDHNLRPESKLEVAYIKKLANRFKFDFVPLSWNPGNKITAIQERARKARYDLMSENCKRLGIPLLLTAHHLDDMLETYLIRKSKKASPLALLPNITYFWDNIWIVRPLFDIEKKELIEYLLKNNITWLEDQSNQSDKYERNRIRKKLVILAKTEKANLLSDYNSSIEKAKFLNQTLIRSLAEVVSIYNYGFAKINIVKFNQLEEEIKIHIINYVLTIISGKTIIPRYRKVINIISLVTLEKFVTSTLNYCKLIVKNKEIIIYKEKTFVENSCCKEQDYKVQSSCYVYYWDNRFEIILDKPGYTISNLKMEEYIMLRKHLNLENLAEDSDNNHKPILFTLPVIKNLEKVVVIPHISYYDSEVLSGAIKVIFKPNFISRFTHFF
jgi:tRNA(Ile)-lysidine synthase